MSIKPRVLFLDVLCPKPYDANSLTSEPLGGSEASCVRVAEGLALTGRYEVIVAQHNRDTLGAGNATYVPFEQIEGLQTNPKAVITLRSSKTVPYIYQKYRDSNRILWSHDFNHQEYVQDADIFKACPGFRILGVSDTHATHIKDSFLRQTGAISGLRVGYVYNPIDNGLKPDETPVDPYKLVFFSSPHKGLGYTLEVFRRLREKEPKFKMFVANPGYMPSADLNEEGVVILGELPHTKVIEHVRSALCTFHLNTVFPETFGLVGLESLAVGTPIVTAPLGANPEILPRSCLIDVRDFELVARKIKGLQAYRHQYALPGKFRLQSVIRKWEEVING